MGSIPTEGHVQVGDFLNGVLSEFISPLNEIVVISRFRIRSTLGDLEAKD